MQKINQMLNNKQVTTVLTLLLALYAGALAPALPNSVIEFFDTVFGKLLFVFLIAYVASKNTQVAIMMSLAFVVTLSFVNKLSRYPSIVFGLKNIFSAISL